MKLQIHIESSEGLYLRNPESSELGKKILKASIELIHEKGFESFTFKKLAEEIHSTEAGIYRYFENKHKLLLYLATWYWGWVRFQIKFHTNNITDAEEKLKRIIYLLTKSVEDDEQTSYINENILHQVIISEGSKAYLTKDVDEDNKHQYFKAYKDLCAEISQVVYECNPNYDYPKSLSSTIIEISHMQNFFMYHLPALTDFGNDKREDNVAEFLLDLVLKRLK